MFCACCVVINTRLIVKYTSNCKYIIELQFISCTYMTLQDDGNFIQKKNSKIIIRM